MSTTEKQQAEERLARSLEQLGARDDRETYRALLRALKARDAEAFARAARYYQEQVVPLLAAGADPIDVWIEYGRMIGELSTPGRMMTIDASGRATPYRAPLGHGELVLFVPDEGRAGSFVAVRPASPTAAQRATIDLLVEGKLGLQPE